MRNGAEELSKVNPRLAPAPPRKQRSESPAGSDAPTILPKLPEDPDFTNYIGSK